MKRLLPLALGLVLGSAALAQEPYPFVSEPIAEFNEPWALEFLPDGRILVTEKPGTIQLVTQDGQKTEITGAPQVAYGGQGGLGDVKLHPEFEQNGIVYLSFAEAGPDETSGVAVGRRSCSDHPWRSQARSSRPPPAALRQAGIIGAH